ncbi:hypothetical protein [Lactococcus chungangensis]|uniref:hypothetical protein n=1 Tax=Pseudolactococcus chungangensis TaxID=451457 RepID=UPI003736CC1B
MTNWITKINGSVVQHATDVHFILNGQAAESAEAVGFSVINYAPYQLRDAADEDVETRVTTLLSGVQPDDLLIVQWPMWQADARFEKIFIEKIRLIPRVKVAALLWEVMPWLMTDDLSDGTHPEMTKLRDFDLLLVGNPKLAVQLRDSGNIALPMLAIGLIDFKCQGLLKAKTDFKDLVFIDSNGNEEEMSYHGQTPFIAMADGGFGVVPAARSQYEAHTNSLELSKYLSMGLPVVIRSNMAQAELVRLHNLGIVLDDLNAIDAVLADMTIMDYQEKLTAVGAWSEAVRSGYFVKRACLESIRILKLREVDYLAEI